MTHRALLTLTALVAATGCGGKSESPYFLPGTELRVSGKYLDEGGVPLSDTPIHFRNIRRFAYIDTTEATIAEGLDRMLGVLLLAAFPFYPFFGGGLLGTDVFSGDRSRFEEKANYYFESVRTDGTGAFSFKVMSDKMLRDEDEGINIVVVNEKKDAPRFGKFAFVLKRQDSDLGELRLSELGGLSITENAGDDTLTFQWDAAPKSVTKHVLRVGTQANDALVWSEETSPDTRSVTLPRALFHALPARAAVEAYYTFNAEKKISFLTSPKGFEVRSTSVPVSRGAVGSSPEIRFRLSSLTNGSYADRTYLEAFDTRSLVLDLGSERTFSRVALHNLRMRAAGTATLSISDDGTTWTTAKSFSEKRFAVLTLDAPATARYVKFAFSARVVDLQEVTLL